MFRIRCRIIDIKEVQRYKYGDDLTCRGCENCPETVNHVLCECTALNSPRCSVGDEYSEILETLEKVVRRAEEFLEIVEEGDEED